MLVGWLRLGPGMLVGWLSCINYAGWVVEVWIRYADWVVELN